MPESADDRNDLMPELEPLRQLPVRVSQTDMMQRVHAHRQQRTTRRRFLGLSVLAAAAAAMIVVVMLSVDDTGTKLTPPFVSGPKTLTEVTPAESDTLAAANDSLTIAQATRLADSQRESTPARATSEPVRANPRRVAQVTVAGEPAGALESDDTPSIDSPQQGSDDSSSAAERQSPRLPEFVETRLAAATTLKPVGGDDGFRWVAHELINSQTMLKQFVEPGSFVAHADRLKPAVTEDPLSLEVSVSEAPWDAELWVARVRIAAQGKVLAPANLAIHAELDSSSSVDDVSSRLASWVQTLPESSFVWINGQPMLPVDAKADTITVALRSSTHDRHPTGSDAASHHLWLTGAAADERPEDADYWIVLSQEPFVESREGLQPMVARSAADLPALLADWQRGWQSPVLQDASLHVRFDKDAIAAFRLLASPGNDPITEADSVQAALQTPVYPGDSKTFLFELRPTMIHPSVDQAEKDTPTNPSTKPNSVLGPGSDKKDRPAGADKPRDDSAKESLEAPFMWVSLTEVDGKAVLNSVARQVSDEVSVNHELALMAAEVSLILRKDDISKDQERLETLRQRSWMLQAPLTDSDLTLWLDFIAALTQYAKATAGASGSG